MDEGLQSLTEDLREKSLLLQQAEQASKRLRTELDTKTAKITELEKQVAKLKERLDEGKEDSLEKNQELRLARWVSEFSLIFLFYQHF